MYHNITINNHSNIQGIACKWFWLNFDFKFCIKGSPVNHLINKIHPSMTTTVVNVVET